MKKHAFTLIVTAALLAGAATALAQAGPFIYLPMVAWQAPAPQASPTPTVTPPPPANMPAFANPGFEAGATAWTEKPSGLITLGAPIDAHAGQWLAWLHDGEAQFNGYLSASLTQNLTVPADIEHAYLTLWFWVQSQEVICEETAGVWADALLVTVNGQAGGLLPICKNQNSAAWRQANLGLDFAQWKGRTVTVRFDLVQDNAQPTNLYLDDISFSAAPPSSAAVLAP